MNFGIYGFYDIYQPATNSLPENTFHSLSDYLQWARKFLNSQYSQGRCPKETAQSEDAVCNVAHRMIWADWTYDETKGLSKLKFRRQMACHAMMDFYRSGRKKSNIDYCPIDDDVCEVSSMDTCDNKDYSTLILEELIENANLTDEEILIISLFRKGYSQKEICASIGRKYDKRVFSKVLDKLSKTAQEQIA